MIQVLEGAEEVEVRKLEAEEVEVAIVVVEAGVVASPKLTVEVEA